MTAQKDKSDKNRRCVDDGLIFLVAFMNDLISISPSSDSCQLYRKSMAAH